MASKRRGKAYRKGLSIIEITKMFPDEDTSREWFEQQRWPKRTNCSQCGSTNVQLHVEHKSQTHRCRVCKKGLFYNVLKDTVMESTYLPLQTWAICIYLFTIGIKGTSSMKLHRDLAVTYRSAWHLAHRLRKAFEADTPEFEGPVEVDESFFEGIERNKHASKTHPGDGTTGKVAVVGIKDQDTGQVHADVISSTGKEALQGLIHKHAAFGVTVYTDDHKAYFNMQGVKHQTVRYSVDQNVNDQATTNGVESY